MTRFRWPCGAVTKLQLLLASLKQYFVEQSTEKGMRVASCWRVKKWESIVTLLIQATLSTNFSPAHDYQSTFVKVLSQCLGRHDGNSCIPGLSSRSHRSWVALVVLDLLLETLCKMTLQDLLAAPRCTSMRLRFCVFLPSSQCRKL
jgi:hypothetical protein